MLRKSIVVLVMLFALSACEEKSNLDSFALGFAQEQVRSDITQAMVGKPSRIGIEEAMRFFNIAYVVDAQILNRDFQQNSVAASAKYEGKKTLFIGRVVSIEQTIMGYPYVNFVGTDPFVHVSAHFSKEDSGKISTYRKGDVVLLVCSSAKYMYATSLSTCINLNEYLNQFDNQIRSTVKVALGTYPSDYTRINMVSELLYKLALNMPADAPCRTNYRESNCQKEVNAIPEKTIKKIKKI